MEDPTTQSDPTPQTFAYRNGIRAAKGVKWIGRKLRAFDNACVASVKRKNKPGWLGHVPLLMISLTVISAVIALLAYWIVDILFTLGFLVIAYSVITNLSSEDFEGLVTTTSNSDEDGCDGYDGYRSGYDGYGYYMGGFNVDDDD